MELMWLVAAILIVGVLVWALGQFDEIDPTFKKAAKIILVVILVILAIKVIFGLVAGSIPPLLR